MLTRPAAARVAAPPAAVLVATETFFADRFFVTGAAAAFLFVGRGAGAGSSCSSCSPSTATTAAAMPAASTAPSDTAATTCRVVKPPTSPSSTLSGAPPPAVLAPPAPQGRPPERLTNGPAVGARALGGVQRRGTRAGTGVVVRLRDGHRGGVGVLVVVGEGIGHAGRYAAAGRWAQRPGPPSWPPLMAAADVSDATLIERPHNAPFPDMPLAPPLTPAAAPSTDPRAAAVSPASWSCGSAGSRSPCWR